MTAVQYPAPTSPVVAQPIIVCDASGNPLNSSAVGNNVNLNQVNGVALSNSNPVPASTTNGALETGGNLATLVANTADLLADGDNLATIAANTALSGDITVLASGSRTTDQTQTDQTNVGARGIRVVLDMTVVTASPSVTLEIDAKDVASGKYVSLLTGAAVVTQSTNVYIVHPLLTAATNSIAKDILPHTWRIFVKANNANAGVYSVGASYLL